MLWRAEGRVPQVADVMSRNRWQAIKIIYICNNSTLRGSSDQLHKLRFFLKFTSKDFEICSNSGESMCG
jgi:hypothetical protein